MKKALTIIISLAFMVSGIWFLLRNIIYHHLLKVSFYRAIPKGVGPILLIVGVIVFFLGYGMEKDN